MSTKTNPEVEKLISEFRDYLKTDEGKSHLSHLKNIESKEVKEVFEKLKNLPKDSDEFIDLVLYGLLPNFKTQYAKRVSIAPSFMNIKKFFARFNYTDNDWKELANLIYTFIDCFEKNPNNLENCIRNFISNRLSKSIQCGSLTPVIFALNQQYPIVNNREINTIRKLSFLIFSEAEEISQKLENYLSNVEKIKRLTNVLAQEYNFKEILDMAVFDLFCYWYDEYKKMLEAGKRAWKSRKLKEEAPKVEPIDQSYIIQFIQILACSPPQPFIVEALKNLNENNKIIYNTEFQRGEVWDIHRKQKLIDSMLRGYNINTIFLRQMPDGKYECLDGQQRLKTILKEFLNDKFSINPRYTPEFNRETLFSELPDTLKSKIRSYIIYAIIFYHTDDEETCKIFLRLQEGLPLNAAEKLNAMIGFLRNDIVELSKHSFMKQLGIKNYRFAHRYVLAQAYLLTLRNQITDTKYKHIQEIYSTYRTTRPSETIGNTLKKVLNFLYREFGEEGKTIRYNADFMSLYLLTKHVLENYVTDSINIRLKDFSIQFLVKVGSVFSSEKEEDAPYYDYKTYRKTSADSRNSIDRRFKILLSKFLEYNQTLIPKDQNRDFDYWEKLAIYWKDKGICRVKYDAECKGKTSFDEGTADHKLPHSKGGKTTIDNGQWSCIRCNLKKLNKIL